VGRNFFQMCFALFSLVANLKSGNPARSQVSVYCIEAAVREQRNRARRSLKTDAFKTENTITIFALEENECQ